MIEFSPDGLNFLWRRSKLGCGIQPLDRIDEDLLVTLDFLDLIAAVNKYGLVGKLLGLPDNLEEHLLICDFISFQTREQISYDQKKIRSCLFEDFSDLPERIDFTLLGQFRQFSVMLDDSIQIFSKGMSVVFHKSGHPGRNLQRCAGGRGVCRVSDLRLDARDGLKFQFLQTSAISALGGQLDQLLEIRCSLERLERLIGQGAFYHRFSAGLYG